MNILRRATFLVGLIGIIAGTPAAETDDPAADAPAYEILSGPIFDTEKGVWRYSVDSPHQHGPNDVEVLLPDVRDAIKPDRVLFVLPVETGIGGRYDDGLQIIRKTGLHNAHQLICVAPAFDRTPWFMDHATDRQRQHERYMRDIVAPLIDDRYPAKGKRSRLLFGFSKSGWGAFTLLMRNPDLFTAAAAWDSPLMLREEDWKNWGIADAAGSLENFRQYQPSKLIRSSAKRFQKETRFVLLGHKFFGSMGSGMENRNESQLTPGYEITRPTRPAFNPSPP